MFDFNADYCVTMEDGGGISVSSIFKRRYCNVTPGRYGGSCCAPTVFEVTWSQSMRDVSSKVERLHHDSKFQCELSVIFCPNFSSLGMTVQVLDFTVGSLVQVACEESSPFDQENRTKFF